MHHVGGYSFLHKFGRTDWATGKALAKMCSEVNNQACAQIARRLMISSSRKWRSTAAHTPRSVQLLPNETDPEMMAGCANGCAAMPSLWARKRRWRMKTRRTRATFGRSILAVGSYERCSIQKKPSSTLLQVELLHLFATINATTTSTTTIKRPNYLSLFT